MNGVDALGTVRCPACFIVIGIREADGGGLDIAHPLPASHCELKIHHFPQDEIPGDDLLAKILVWSSAQHDEYGP